jgi:pSer/pThr/pTyr-binding forkhead associated (FHA) protein
MPLLILGADRCSLHPGTHTIGGRGADALQLAALDWHSAVATITVPTPGTGPALIRRITASVVVRLNDEPMGIAAAELHNGATIDFDGCRLIFETDNTGKSAVATHDHFANGNGNGNGYGGRSGREWTPDRPASHSREPAPASSLTTGIGARLVNVQTGHTFALTDRRIVIGRDESCDVVISGKGISRRHASVSPVGGGYLLRDESANGTTVNGAPVAGTYLLAHGDMVRMHDEQLRFDVEGMTEAPEKDSEATQILDLTHITRGLGSATNGRRITCTLEIEKGPFAGATFELDKPVCAIGRARHNDVKVRDDSVSATHATLLRKGTIWYVVDLRSANGTFVDGSRVAGERELPSGARLKVGAVELIFRSFTDGVEEGGVRRIKVGLRHWLTTLIRGPNRPPDFG